jgi:hypothetical protein
VTVPGCYQKTHLTTPIVDSSLALLMVMTWPRPAASSSWKTAATTAARAQAHLPLPEPTRRAPTFGEVLALLAGTGAGLLNLPVRRRKVLGGVISEYH